MLVFELGVLVDALGGGFFGSRHDDNYLAAWCRGGEIIDELLQRAVMGGVVKF